MKKLIAFAALSALFLQTRAQSITGSVTDKTTNETLAAAAITAYPGPIGAITDENGRYTLKVPQPGNYTVEVSFIGYKSSAKEIYVSENVTLDFSLQKLTEELQQVNITATRAGDNSPIAHENIDRQTLQDRNQGQDIPYILNQATSVVTTSDAGAGIGYTGLRIRGSDQTRINVTINGIPVNDAESHGVFWVNTPDLTSSLQSVQIQRGVGTSTNGAGAFGATINLQSNDLRQSPFGNIHLGGGSFNTQRYTLELGTGLIKDHWILQGRLSQISSDGYVDRSRSNLQSYFFSGGYVDKVQSLKAVVFGGKEETYQAWYGLDSATYFNDRTFNYAGAIYDTAFNITGYYDNQVDHYGQNHYQLHYNRRIGENWAVNLSGHFTHGEGYYEEYQSNDSLYLYGISTPTKDTSDVVRRLWLNNDFYGVVYNAKYEGSRFDLILGGAANKYVGKHYGEIMWSRVAGNTQPGDRFYTSSGNKTDVNFYAKAFYKVLPKVQLFADAQYRWVALMGSGDDELARSINFSDDFNFFNPKMGITSTINDKVQVYASYAIAHREPNRQDYIENAEKPQAEQLQDIEAGTRLNLGKTGIDINLFGMFYKNQLVLTGELNNVGYPIRKNTGKSYRTGVEISANTDIAKWLHWAPNVTYSINRNVEFIGDDLTNYGETPIAYSPAITAGSVLEFQPLKGLRLAILNKYVGDQYLNNTGLERFILEDYFLTNLRVIYSLPVNLVKAVELQLLINNVTNEKYAANGYEYYGTPYYYPQAGINFLAGVKVMF